MAAALLDFFSNPTGGGPMCGFAGYYALIDQPAPAGWSSLALDLLGRRGPDARGTAQGSRWGLVFTRLAVRDLSPSGAQPMHHAASGSWLVFNGELYDIESRRQSLADRGFLFRSTSDTEVLLASLVLDGPGPTLARLDGMFAFAFWDGRHQTMCLARDHAGIKPLYFAQTANGLVFGSQLDVVACHPWLRQAGLDPEGFATYLRLGFVPEPHSPLAGISSLEPGLWLELDARGASRKSSFFALDEGRETAAELPELLQAAVHGQLVADVPLGVLLSGGIDSPLVAGLASRRFPGLEAFTIGRPDDLDESASAARYASDFGLRHDCQTLGDGDVVGLFDEVALASSEPLGDYSILPTLAVARRARQRVVVALSGDGSDELFFGYAGRMASVLRPAPAYRFPQIPRRLASLALRLVGREGARGSRSWPSIGAWYWAKHSHFSEESLARLFPDLPPPRATQARLFGFQGWQRDEVAAWLRENEWRVHLRRVLRKVDVGAMFHSLEVRVPLLSRPLVAYAFSRPWQESLDLQATRGKLPLRRELAKLSGHQVEEKRGFGVPLEAWLAGPLHERATALLQDAGWENWGIHHAAWKNLGPTCEPAWSTWLLLSLAMWRQQLAEKRAAAAAAERALG